MMLYVYTIYWRATIFIIMLNLGALLNGKQLTLSSAAWLLARYPDPIMWEVKEYNMVHGAVEAALAQIKSLPCIPDIDELRMDKRVPQISMSTTLGAPMKVFTDYSDARRHVEAADYLQLVETVEEADFLLVLKQVTNFMHTPLNQFIGQYPYEGGFVRKDLLPLTIRKCCYVDNQPPSWWLPCFDVSTEFHLLYQEYSRRLNNCEQNWWILKPGQGSRGQGHKIFFSPRQHECPFDELAANCSPFDADNSTDKVAQLLVQNPMLALGRKFDLRLFVVVRSFIPFQIFVHNNFYARLANKPYDTAALHSSEVAITVNAYDEDESIAAKQERLKFDELRNVILQEVWELSVEDAETDRYRDGLRWWEGVVQSIYQTLRELFGGIAPTVGEWPLSRAYYAVDVMLENCGTGVNSTTPLQDQLNCTEDARIYDLSTAEAPTAPIPPKIKPKLMEVNYMGDWAGMEGALRVRDPFIEVPGYAEIVKPSFPGHDFDSWCQNILSALMTDLHLDEALFTRL